MNVATSFKEMGFLASSVIASTAAFAERFAGWAELYHDLNRFAQQQFYVTQVRNSDLRGLLLHSCFYRLLSTYQSAFLLIERGSDIDAKALLRNLVETLFVLAATSKDKSFAREYVVVDESKRVALLRNVISTYRELKEEKADLFLTEEQVAEMERDIATYEREAKNPDSKIHVKKEWKQAVKVFNVAERGGLKRVYNQHYSFLCLFAHPSPNGMRDYLIKNAAGEICTFKAGQRDDDAEANMRVAMVMLLSALGVYATFFKRDLNERLHDYSARLDEVIAHSHTQLLKA